MDCNECQKNVQYDFLKLQEQFNTIFQYWAIIFHDELMRTSLIFVCVFSQSGAYVLHRIFLWHQRVIVICRIVADRSMG